MESSSLSELAARTQVIYERNAAAWDAQRPKRLHEKAWLDRFAALLPPGGTILDAGCGAGEPFPAYFLEQGFAVEGADFSEPMLGLCRARFPELAWHFADLRTLELGRTYDGLLAWNSFFHLTPEEQTLSLPRLAAHVAPGGAMMLTVGPEAGEVTGHVNGELVYHASLAPETYAQLLSENGFRVIAFVKEDETCDFQTVLLARKDDGA